MGRSQTLSEAIRLVKLAISADQENEYETALPLYQEALQYFETGVTEEANPVKRQEIISRVEAYRDRARVLDDFLIGLTRGDDSETPYESSTYEEDPEMSTDDEAEHNPNQSNVSYNSDQSDRDFEAQISGIVSEQIDGFASNVDSDLKLELGIRQSPTHVANSSPKNDSGADSAEAAEVTATPEVKSLKPDGTPGSSHSTSSTNSAVSVYIERSLQDLDHLISARRGELEEMRRVNTNRKKFESYSSVGDVNSNSNSTPMRLQPNPIAVVGTEPARPPPTAVQAGNQVRPVPHTAVERPTAPVGSSAQTDPFSQRFGNIGSSPGMPTPTRVRDIIKEAVSHKSPFESAYDVEEGRHASGLSGSNPGDVAGASGGRKYTISEALRPPVKGDKGYDGAQTQNSVHRAVYDEMFNQLKSEQEIGAKMLEQIKTLGLHADSLQASHIAAQNECVRLVRLKEEQDKVISSLEREVEMLNDLQAVRDAKVSNVEEEIAQLKSNLARVLEEKKQTREKLHRVAEERSALAGKLEGKLSAFQRGEEDDNSAAQLSPQELSECMRSCAAVARRRGARDDDVAAMVNVRQFQATPKASRTGFLSILAVLQSVVLFLLLLLAKGSLYADTCRIDQLRTTS